MRNRQRHRHAHTHTSKTLRFHFSFLSEVCNWLQLASVMCKFLQCVPWGSIPLQSLPHSPCGHTQSVWPHNLYLSRMKDQNGHWVYWCHGVWITVYTHRATGACLVATSVCENNNNKDKSSTIINTINRVRTIWLGWVSCCLFPIQNQSQPTKSYLLWEKSGPKCHISTYFFLFWVGLGLLGRSSVSQ